jgi:outer membrane lipoprotein-sorting protein
MTATNRLDHSRFGEELDRILRCEAPSTPAAGDHDVATARLLADNLSRLRQSRPTYQAQLEARLLARLPEATRPWWVRTIAPLPRRNGRAPSTARRRMLAGLAAGVVGAVALGSVALPLSRPREVSAAEIFEKAQSLAENPFLAGVKSFHLTAKSTGRPFRPGDTTTVTTEQWFVAPDKMRMESRARSADGTATIGGSVHVGDDFKMYATPGADPLDVVGVMPAVPVERDDPVEGGHVSVSIVRAQPDGAPPREDAPVGVIIRRPKPDGSRAEEEVEVIGRVGPDGAPDASPGLATPGTEVIVVDNCPPPKRKGEGTVAGRSVHIVEMDHSSCLPANAPEEMRGRIVTWADQKTYVPLKIEHYGGGGKLVHSYEVTSIEYDVAIPDSVFKDLPPAGTSVVQLPAPPFAPVGESAPLVPGRGPLEKPAPSPR